MPTSFLKPASVPFLERILYSGIFLQIILVPLPYASNRPIFSYFWAFYNGALLLIWLLSRSRRSLTLRQVWFIAIPLLLVFSWIACQVWLPRFWPHRWWYELSSALNSSLLLQRISIDPHTTLIGLLHYLSYAAFFWLVLQLCALGYGKRILRAIFYAATFYAMYGLFSFSVSSKDFVLFPHEVYTPGISSTYMNRDHFSTHVGMGLMVGLCLFFQKVRRDLKQPNTNLANQFKDLLTSNLSYLLGMAILLTVLLLSLSRAGIVAAMAGLLLFFLGTFFVRDLRLIRRPMLIINTVALIIFLFLVLVGGHGFHKRLMDIEDDLFLRSKIYRTTLRAIHSDYLLTGSGLGTFDKAYQAYVTEDTITYRYVDYAHNTYLGKTLELGLPAFLLLLCPFFLSGLYALRVALTANNKQIQALAFLAILLQAALHAMLDFSFEIPAVLTTYIAIAGVFLADFLQRRKYVT